MKASAGTRLIGRIVVYREVREFILARVAEQSPERLRVRRWLTSKGRWSHGLQRLQPSDVIAVLPKRASPPAILEQISAAQRKRDDDLRQVRRGFDADVRTILQSRSA
ncbi:hypothetical protein D2V17_14355 [Aurantiacibacter xanthus]|uniref:Uncharacterized protein n=1 Tax=Aurantiacibacter xanthus TaxID=1784712 RepID=A0A3A1P342_9SPHN|nr:hypothetical protein [Aurantiacibacter xanthus]RIV82980.1 hypothetical protein D2V17_14355 [Aurantiacibacter xanthus]